MPSNSATPAKVCCNSDEIIGANLRQPFEWSIFFDGSDLRKSIAFDGFKLVSKGNASQTAQSNVVFLELFDRSAGCLGKFHLQSTNWPIPPIWLRFCIRSLRQVSTNAHLSANHTARPNDGRSSDAALCGDDRGFADDDIVRHLNKLSSLHPFRTIVLPSVARSMVVNAHVAVIFNHDISGLGTLAYVPSSLGAKQNRRNQSRLQIGACIVIRQSTIEDPHSCEHGILSDAYVSANMNVGMQLDTVSDHSARSMTTPGPTNNLHPKTHLLPPPQRDARLRCVLTLHQKLQAILQMLDRVINSEQRKVVQGFSGIEVPRNNDHTGLCSVEKSFVFRIDKKETLPGPADSILANRRILTSGLPTTCPSSSTANSDAVCSMELIFLLLTRLPHSKNAKMPSKLPRRMLFPIPRAK